MEPHGQSPWFLRNAHKGRTSRTRGPIHPRVEPVVLLVRDRVILKILKMSHKLTHNSETILASKGIFYPFMGIGVIMPDSINPETVFIPTSW